MTQGLEICNGSNVIRFQRRFDLSNAAHMHKNVTGNGLFHLFLTVTFKNIWNGRARSPRVAQTTVKPATLLFADLTANLIARDEIRLGLDFCKWK